MWRPVVAALLVGAGAVLPTAQSTKVPATPSELPVRAPGEAAIAERTAIEFTTRLLEHLEQPRRGFASFTSISPATALGTSRVDQQLVVGLRASAMRDGQATAVYAVVTLTPGPTRYLPEEATFSCDPDGVGIAFPLTVGDQHVVVALGAGALSAPANVFGVAVQPGISMQAWLADAGAGHRSEALLLGSGRATHLCS